MKEYKDKQRRSISLHNACNHLHVERICDLKPNLKMNEVKMRFYGGYTFLTRQPIYHDYAKHPLVLKTIFNMPNRTYEDWSHRLIFIRTMKPDMVLSHHKNHRNFFNKSIKQLTCKEPYNVLKYAKSNYNYNNYNIEF